MADIPNPPVVLGPDGKPVKPEAPPEAAKPKLTDREPLSDIQERLRRESAARARGKYRGRQM